MRSIRSGSSGLVLAVVFLVTAVVTLHADGFRNPPEGAAPLGRAGSRLTTADDASTVTHNPANLYDLAGSTVLTTWLFGYAEKTYTAATGASESMNTLSVMPAIYAATPLAEGKYVLGIGVHSPYGQANEWNERGIFTGMTAYRSELQTINAAPALSAKLSEKVRLGLGVNILWADFELAQTMPWSGLPGDLLGPSSHASLTGDGVGAGMRAGLTWLVTPKQRLALVYHSPVSVNCKGEFELSAVPPGLPPSITATSEFETKLEFPQIVALGYGCRLLDNLRVEANIEWVEHSRYERSVIDAGNNNLLLQGFASADPLVAPQDWDDTWTFSIGADWDINENWVLRCGWINLPSPIPDSTVLPTSAETDSNIITVGVGYHNARHRLDVSLAPTINDDRNDAMGGKYEVDSGLAAVSYACTF